MTKTNNIFQISRETSPHSHHPSTTKNSPPLLSSPTTTSPPRTSPHLSTTFTSYPHFPHTETIPVSLSTKSKQYSASYVLLALFLWRLIPLSNDENAYLNHTCCSIFFSLLISDWTYFDLTWLLPRTHTHTHSYPPSPSPFVQNLSWIPNHLDHFKRLKLHCMFSLRLHSNQLFPMMRTLIWITYVVLFLFFAYFWLGSWLSVFFAPLPLNSTSLIFSHTQQPFHLPIDR